MPGTRHGGRAEEKGRGWALMIASLILNTYYLGFGLFWDGLFLQKIKAWEVQTAWRQTKCKVLAAGVSCASEDSRDSGSTCYGYKAGAMPNQRVPVFLTEQIAVCPGTYRCAKREACATARGKSLTAPSFLMATCTKCQKQSNLTK